MNNQSKKSLLAPLLVLVTVLLAIVGCSDPLSNQSDYILDNVGKLEDTSGSIEYGEKILVDETAIAGLFADLAPLETRSEKKNLIENYIMLNERLNCILDKISESKKDNTVVQCQGDTLVEIEGQNGLSGVEAIFEMLTNEKDKSAKRILLSAYLEDWTEVQMIDRVEKSLNQIKRTKEIPLLGLLLNNIHDFPIMYEGIVLVPKGDINGLMGEFIGQKTNADQRLIITKYLDGQ